MLPVAILRGLVGAILARIATTRLIGPVMLIVAIGDGSIVPYARLHERNAGLEVLFALLDRSLSECARRPDKLSGDESESNNFPLMHLAVSR